MSESEFILAVKSTIDKLGYDLGQAESPAITFVDLEDTINTTALFKTNDTAYVWDMAVLAPSPRDPLYSVAFSVGARTVNDSANFTSLALVGKVKSAFSIGESIEVRLYSGPTAGPVMGSIYMTSAIIMPHNFDKVAGIRMVSVQGKAVRHD